MVPIATQSKHVSSQMATVSFQETVMILLQLHLLEILRFTDGVDQDCDGIADDKASDGTMFYVDADGDGYGTEQSIVQCLDSSTGLAPDGFSMMGRRL